MIIIDKDHLPLEIVNDESAFDETTFFLLKTNKLLAGDIDNYFKKYHKPLDRKELKKKYEQYELYFYEYDKRNAKIINSPFLRNYIRDLKRKTNFKVSINNAKNVISHCIISIIVEASERCCQNLLKEKYIDLFEATLTSKHLKDYFDDMMTTIIQVFADDNIYVYNSPEYAKFTLYRRWHGKYLIELNQENPNYDKLVKIKEKLDEFNQLDLTVIKGKTLVLLEKLRKSSEELLVAMTREPNVNSGNSTDKMYQEVFDSAKTLLQTEKLNIQDDEVSNFLNSIVETDEDKKTTNLLIEKFKEYFPTNSTGFKDYHEEIRLLNQYLNYRKDDDLSFFDYLFLTIFITNIAFQTDNKLKILLKAEEIYEHCDKQVYELFNLLTFNLWHCNDEKRRLKRIQAFDEIIATSPDCYETFLDLRDAEIDYSIEFTPLDRYYNDKVGAVLINLDINAVARKLRKLILDDYDDYDIIVENKKFTTLYENKDLDFTDFDTLNKLADLFILSYLKDRRYLASFTPFKREFNNLYFDFGELSHTIQSFIENNLEGRKTGTDQDIEILNDCKQLYNNILEKYNELDDPSEFIYLDDFEIIMRSLGKTKYFFNPLPNYQEMLINNRTIIINYLYLNDVDEFKKLDFKEQLNKIANLCYINNLVTTIIDQGKYMPKKDQVEQDEYISSLKDTIGKKEKIIKDQKNQIKRLSKQTMTPVKKNQDTKLLEQELDYYRQEISTLKKQLNSKEQKITKLKKNQQELYKLRELVFKMENQSIENNNLPIDLNEVIKNKDIVIIGGHINLRKKLREKYPSLILFSKQNAINEAVLKRADHVFIYYNFMTHDMYNRAVSVLSRNNIAWDYIPYTNLEKSEQLIYQILNKNRR